MEFNIDDDAPKELQRLLQQERWESQEFNYAFDLWLRCATEKAGNKFSLEQALMFSTKAFDQEGMNIVKSLWNGSSITPYEVFEKFANVFTQEMIKQVDILNLCLSTAIVSGVGQRYRFEDEYSVSPDHLLLTIENTLDEYHVHQLEIGIEDRMKKNGLGEYAEIIRQGLKKGQIKAYRRLLEEGTLIEFLKIGEQKLEKHERDSFLQGINERDAIDTNIGDYTMRWTDLIFSEFDLLLKFNKIYVELICNNVVERLKKDSAEEGSGFNNFWEEFCAKKAGYNFCWEVYKDAIDVFIVEELHNQPQEVRILLSHVVNQKEKLAESSFVYNEVFAVYAVNELLIRKADNYEK